MKKLLQLKTMLLLCALIVGSGSTWADDITYVFNSKSWGAKVGSTDANWTSGKDGNSYNAGIQVTTGASGANGTSPVSFKKISKVTVYYHTNKNDGVGTIKVKVGSGTEKSYSVTKPGKDKGLETKSTDFSFDNETGNVKITVLCTTNSVYIEKVDIIFDPTINITSIELDKNEIGVGVGGNVTLVPTITPSDATENVVWESDDTDVATVSDGVVTGVAVGTATITAKSPSDGAIKDECVVTVSDAVPVSGVSLNKNSTSILIGGTETLEATVSPVDATNKNVTWESSDEDVATVEDGVVTAVGVGSATITVSSVADPTKSASCTVTVNPIVVTGVSLNKTATTIKVGQTETLTETVVPVNATDKSVTWESSDEDVATVEDGVITAIAEGTAIITVKTTDGSKTATCEVTVTDSEPLPFSQDFTSSLGDWSTSGTETVWTQHSTYGAVANTTSAGTYDLVSPLIELDDNREIHVAMNHAGRYLNSSFQEECKLMIKIKGGDWEAVPINTLSWFTNNDWNFVDAKMILDSKYAGKKVQFALRYAPATNPGSSAKWEVKSFSVTAEKYTPTISFANDEVFALDEDGIYAQTATVSQGDYTGTISYAITSSTSTGALIDDVTGEVAFDKKGVIVVTATASETATYKSNTASYTLKVRTTPTILVADDAISLDETFTVDDSDIEGGDITVTSGNTDIATVTGLVVTPIVAGKVIITVETAANDDYIAGSETFELTINGPVGSDTKPSSSSTTTFTNKNLNHSGGVDWTASEEANAFETQSPSRCVQFGAGIGTFTLSTSAYTGTVTKVSMVMSTNGSGNTIAVKVGDNDFTTTYGGISATKTLTLTSMSNQTVEFIGEGVGNIVISCNDINKSIYFKSITVEVSTIASVTIATSGYGTYCYQYPLTLANTDDYKAYIVTNVSENTVTFTNVTGDIKGGVPFILYGNKGTYDIALADESTTVPAGNMLKGTLAPTYVATVEGDYTNFGLSGGEFKKITSGVVPANKAYLPVLTSELPASGRLSIVFEEEETGIKSMRDSGKFLDNTVYNLRGQRVENPTKGLYIVNGRKVVVK